jgi:hypothetical protein
MPFALMLVGEKMQAEFAGRSEQVNETVSMYPVCALKVMLYGAACPWSSVCVVVVGASEYPATLMMRGDCEVEPVTFASPA